MKEMLQEIEVLVEVIRQQSQKDTWRQYDQLVNNPLFGEKYAALSEGTKQHYDALNINLLKLVYLLDVINAKLDEK